jgi:hypothetical protein
MKRRTPVTRTLVAFLAVVTAAATFEACSAQAGRQYQGQPIATIRGSVVTQSSPAPSSMNVVIAWAHNPNALAPGQGTAPPGLGSPVPPPTFVGTEVSVTGSFPASFTLNVYDAPPSDQQLQLGYDYQGPEEPTLSGVWLGYIVAVSSSASSGPLQTSDILGVDTGHVVLYFDHDGCVTPPGCGPVPADATLGTQPPGTYFDFMEGYYQVQPVKGYHLAKVDLASQALVAQQTTCYYGSLCVHVENGSDPGVNGASQDENDWAFARCTRLLPSNQTCTETFEADGGLSSSSASTQCAALMQANTNPQLLEKCFPPAPDSGAFASFAAYVHFDPNPNGLADPVTIDLGTAIWDGFFQ